MKVLRIDCFRKVLIFKVALICLIYRQDGVIVDYDRYESTQLEAIYVDDEDGKAIVLEKLYDSSKF